MNNRRFSRVSFRGKAHIELAATSFATEVLDLSLKGALVKKPEGWPAQLPGQMTLKIELNDLPVALTMRVSIAHQTEEVLGFHCDKIDIESVAHLRRLLELNLGDADLLSRELSELSAGD